ncbi:hypothetical protein [Cellulomonas sp. NS3]|uniref:hypothetical protein n=1 Tax=Cellulomonas sp. NS3 TaxID=2973977 RepID=UPI00216185CF|nr:hypothetical protein [Cellulomonas sp. NS3]
MPKSSKPKKPPIDKKAVTAKLERAQQDQLRVRVRRWIPDADPVEGFVVGIGRRWVALAQLSDRILLDGWALVRLKDIQAVKIYPDPNTFATRALRLRSQWPPVAPPVDLDHTVAAITAATKVAPLLTVHEEFARPDVCWIGMVRSVDDTTLALHEVDGEANWLRKVTMIDLDSITRLDMGGGYEEALHLVAGEPPKR